jgi:tryptophan synthase alpha chain
MTRIEQLFAQKNKNILNVYCTAGFPELHSTITVLQSLQDSGVDMIEIGMPFSDPLADGPVIQQSSLTAIANGMSLPVLFEQLQQARPGIRLPLILMGYMNPILQFGFEKFCAAAAAAGIDGLILPDLPLYEFQSEYGAIIQQYGLNFIFLITPETTEERIRQADALGNGFLYAVSSSSTTGSNKDLGGQSDYFNRLAAMQLRLPVLVGFGIGSRAAFLQACQHASGAIIGSAYIRAIAGSSNIAADTGQFIRSILQAQEN